MRSEVSRKVSMAVRVRDFLKSRPFGTEKADGVVAKFNGLVERALELDAQVAVGDHHHRDAGTARRQLRRDISTRLLRHLVRISNAAAAEKSEIGAGRRVPAGNASDAKFRSTAHAILAVAEANAALLANHGMKDDAVLALTEQLAEYDRLAAAVNAGREAHTGARGELGALASALMGMVKQIEGMLVMRFPDDPNLEASWRSARNVAWPTQATPTAGSDPKAA